MSGQERRSQIIQAAYAVILEKGLADTATRDVTRRLGVGSGLLHHYFDTWKSLRAEVVREFIAKEIEDLSETLKTTPPDKLLNIFVDWMVEDPEFDHWTLWLDAIEEARRDPELAKVVEAGYIQWHSTIRDLLSRVVDAGHGTCAHIEGAAWRISALIDGLVGMLTFGLTPISTDAVKDALQTQLTMELQIDLTH